MKITIIGLAYVSLFAAGCGATDVTDRDAKIVETAISDVDKFCDVVDGKKSVSLDSYDRLDESASSSVKKLISLYDKDPNGTYSPDGDEDKNSQTIGELLRGLGERLASCDPAQANRVRKAMNAAA